MIANPQYARALLATQAAKIAETIGEVMKDETSQILRHKLAEIRCDCEWMVDAYGGEE